VTCSIATTGRSRAFASSPSVADSIGAAARIDAAGRASDERRRTNPEPERRAGRRRAGARPVKPPVPPPEASRFVDQIVFFERLEQPS